MAGSYQAEVQPDRLRGSIELMAPRPSWKGFLRLSLVTVPVKAYTASLSGNDIRLNQLHAECNNRVRYLKSCPEHGTITNDEIVSGYEYTKGNYVVVDLEELSKLRPESDRTVRIDGFVNADTIDPVYLSGRTYYLLPEGVVGQKPYSLLLRSMIDADVHAVAQVVIAGREQVVLVKPMEKAPGHVRACARSPRQVANRIQRRGGRAGSFRRRTVPHENVDRRVVPQRLRLLEL